MDLAERDRKIFQMKAELENRKKILDNKRKELKQTSRENELLIQVLADYNNHNHDIVNQKREKIDLLKSLHEYIGNVSHNKNAVLLKESKMDQREILKEINHLKHTLDEITD